LLVTFFGCRIVWGTYQSISIYSDIYKALTFPTSGSKDALLDDVKRKGNESGIGQGTPNCVVGELPMWLVYAYLLGNTALSLLNFYWFAQMVKAVRKRFRPTAAQEKKAH